MAQGFEIKQKTKKIHVEIHCGKQKEVTALQADQGLKEAWIYYNHMERYRQRNREVLGM